MKPKPIVPTTFASLAMAASAWAASPVPITNAGFEDPVVAADGSVGGAPAAWPSFNGGSRATLNPGTGDLSAQAPEGSNVALVTSSAAEDGLFQTLASPFQADATYVLTVKVANTLFTDGFPGYRVQLVAGSTVLAEDDNSQPVAEDGVVTSTVNYSYNAGLHAALVGQPLEIRLLSKGLTPSMELGFDDVQLTVALANPAANPGGPYTVSYNGPLTLDGSGSQPSDGATLTTYEWDLDNDGDYDEAITGATPAAIPYATLIAASPGGFGMEVGANTIKLRVTDNSSPTPKTSTVEGIVNLGGTMVIYEPFADPNGTLDLNTAGAGLTGTWSSTANVAAGSLAYGALPVGSGSKVSSNNTYGAVSVGSTLSTAGLLADGTELWFSALIQSGSDVGTNGDLGFVLGTDRISSGNNIPVQNSGRALGVRLKNNQMRAAYWSPDILQSTGPANSAPNNTLFLIVGRFIWGATSDTVEIYKVGPDLVLPATPTSTYTTLVNVDQTLFDTVSFGTKGANPFHFIDEIRFGVTSADVLPTNAGPPTLASADIVDNKTGGPILESTTLVYTLSFNENLDAASVAAEDFENGGTAPITINSVTTTNNQVFVTVTPTFPGATGTLQLQVKSGAVINDFSGTPLVTTSPIADDTVITVNADTIAPTVLSIVSPPAVSPIYGLPVIPYTVTFDKYFINDATVTAADFVNAGTATVGIGPVTRISTGTAPAAYTFEVTPSSTGTVQLQLSGTVSDVMGNSVVVPFDDDTTYTLAGSEPARKTILFDAFTSVLGVLNVNPTNISFDASASDKLVVVATGEHNFGGDLSSNIVSVKYDGVDLTKAVEVNPASFNLGGHGQTAHDIWYLDNPSAVHTAGNIAITIVGNGANYVYTAIRLSDTAPGAAAVASSIRSASTRLITSSPSSMVISSIGMGGNGNTATPLPGVAATSPLTVGVNTFTFTGLENGTNWAGHAVARSSGLAVNSHDFTFGTAATDVATVAVEFLGAESTGSPYGTWALGPFSATLSDTSANLDFDGGGLATGLEWVLGGDPTLGSDDAGIAPDFDNTSDPDFFIFIYNRSDAALADPNTTIAVQYSTNLTTWTTAAAGPDIVITPTDNGASDSIQVKLRRTLAAPGGRLFVRLNVTVAP